ncbi:hypothetical protein NST38_12940 [Paenibacillus sp. FSL H8-0104]|uniref:hypothetical protein n=1 Tax=Paenibacillus sp. FSL H8-0104 TaxID=2954509 RepID=UPI0030FDDD52
MLTKRQQLVKEGIQEVFNNDRINIVHLSGPPGIGKTFLVKKYLDEIINSYEDWKGYHIEGNKGDIDAYSTIIHSETSNRINENTGTNFNLGFSIPLVFSVGLTSAFKRKEIFDSKIDFFLRQLRKSSESNIVIVADSYEYWDKHSKSFIEAIISRKHLLKSKNIRLVIITNEEDRAKVTDISFKNFITSGKHYKLIAPEINELTEIISLLGYKLSLSRSELDTIMSLSGANIDFINMVVDGLYNDQQAKLYPDEKGFSINEILENRLRIFGNKEKDVNDILKASSVIDGDFNTDEVSYLCDEKYETEDLLSQSCTYLLLKKGNQFAFSNTLIQSFFYDKATETQSKFHYKYYKYLKQNRSESYSLRALHLSSANKEKIY